MSNVTRFERAIVQFTPNISVDGYRTPSGEFRVGYEGASRSIGFAANWLSRTLTENRTRTLEALRSQGFKHLPKVGLVEREGRGTIQVSTLSLEEYAVLIAYAAAKGKRQAQALQVALVEMSLRDFFRDAFGDSPLTMDQKRDLFCKAYAASLDWFKEDRYDVQSLWMAGDPEEIRGWNNSVNWIQ